MDILKRFERYVTIETTSDEASDTAPSTAIQLNLAKVLEQELKEIGVPKVMLDEYGIVYGWLPASEGLEKCPPIGFIAHMDTAPAASGKDVKICYHENYDGKDVRLNDELTLSVKMFPHLSKLTGRTLLTTDGRTLLGADDKAGITEIMTAIEHVISEEKPHGPICIAFTPDEEIGRGADNFNVDLFGADYAYTVDGGPENDLAWETFNAASAQIKVHGVSVHPGEATDVMVNAVLVAFEFNQMLPANETPRYTKDYEGFYHLDQMSGDVAEASMDYIIRDHDREIFEQRKIKMQEIADALNAKYGEGTVEICIKDSYYNMKEILVHHMHLVDNAKEAMRQVGITADVLPVRGGTDGSRLSFMGLPCPNLGTGGYAYHGPYEHITKEGMETATKVIEKIIELYAKGEN
jgi:tripeptide aminopeptidase